ncbi:cell wall elongation regulator TseB-like domain-containing protein [Virgibacillus sp. MG-45]|uniref:cell wall elongation regulator TseB-like domain-containing protein n=1 Tax=Virgibacillus sp. MG-45 TaxID=3102791 RepID=UPI002EDA3CEC
MMFYHNKPRFSSWVKWLAWITIIIAVAIFCFLIYLYNVIQHEKTQEFDQTKKIVFAETALTEINEITRFHGDQYYHAVVGKTDQKDVKIVFVLKKENSNEISVFDMDEMISKDKVNDMFIQTCSNCKLLKTTPAIMNNKPFWELTYTDGDRRHVIEYVSMHDGSKYEQFRFKHLFQ